MEDKSLGKISQVYFGLRDGYQYGLHFKLSGQGWGTDWGEWYNILCEMDDKDSYALKMLKVVHKLLEDAKVDTVDQLENKPVEVVFEDRCLKSYRILTEVL